jgi:thiol-disulfide isomerase/thioredoxin
MKKILLLYLLFFSLAAPAQDGYEIKVTFRPFKGEYIYLGHYFGKQYPIVDSVKLDANSQGTLKGNKKLPGGIYLVGYPNKTGFFEILIDRQQKFSIIADTATLRTGPKFENSSDNTLFISYQQKMNNWGRQINELQQKLKTPSVKDSASIREEILKLDKQILAYREGLIKDHEGSLLALLLNSMRDPELPLALKNPKTRTDSLASYQFYKSHYWDGVALWDGRLAYTPFFEDKVDKYFAQLVVPNPDSVIKEIDWMMGYASISEEMTRFLLIKFANRYLNQKYMWEDAVFVHLFEKYFAQKNYPWLSDAGRKTITDRAYSLMANIMGKPASDIYLPDSTGAYLSLYEMKADYTLVAFWDPKCGHCKEVLPKLDSFYHAKWKNKGLKIFAVAKETDGTRADWLNFINEHKLKQWTNVYYSKAEDRSRVDNSIPGYSQLYDVQSFPTLYLLDREKLIVAKKLSFEQINEVLEMKLKAK